MKKFKIISIIMTVALIAAIAAGCGSSKPASTSKESSATSAASASTAAAGEASATSDSESSTASASVASSASSASEASSASAASASSASAASSASEASSASSASTAAASGELVPSITIEYGDVAAIEALAKDAQNKKIEEGTVVAISGYYSKPINSMNIMESDDSGKKGIVMIVDGDWEAPAEGTDIDIIGTFVNGQYNSELHVLPENITIK